MRAGVADLSDSEPFPSKTVKFPLMSFHVESLFSSFVTAKNLSARHSTAPRRFVRGTSSVTQTQMVCSL